MSRVLHCKCSKTPHPCSRTAAQTRGEGWPACAALHCFGRLSHFFFSSLYHSPPQPHLTTTRPSSPSPAPNWFNSSRKSSQRFPAWFWPSTPLIPSYHQGPFPFLLGSIVLIPPRLLRNRSVLTSDTRATTADKKDRHSSSSPRLVTLQSHAPCNTIAVARIYHQTRYDFKERIPEKPISYLGLLHQPYRAGEKLFRLPHLPLNIAQLGRTVATDTSDELAYRANCEPDFYRQSPIGIIVPSTQPRNSKPAVFPLQPDWGYHRSGRGKPGPGGKHLSFIHVTITGKLVISILPAARLLQRWLPP